MICGVTFAPFAVKGTLANKQAQQSLQLLHKNTNANLIVLVPVGLQDTPHSVKIDFTGEEMAADAELEEIIAQAHAMGMRVAIKPTVNCRNGVWRAYINFFDNDVPCEPKWKDWFASYTAFQLHYAEIAQRTGCEMFIAGCEMVLAQRREAEWRTLFSDIRQVYRGPVSYNTDKYQEENVPFWDAVDVISSSGYYPVNDWENQLDRIEQTVKKYGKSFFFAEAGCMSAEGSWQVPNDWSLQGGVNTAQQAEWYRAMFTACQNRDWVQGFAVWDWPAQLYAPQEAGCDNGYAVYAKPAEEVIKKWYSGNAAEENGFL